MPRKKRPRRPAPAPAGRTGARPAPARRLELPRRPWVVPVALVAILLLGFGLRAADLRADPPPDLSWSFAPYTDEGLNTYSARSYVLSGAWKTDDFFPFVVYPLFNFLVALAFRLFGIGFVTVKLVSLLAGLGSILALYKLVRDGAGPLAGLIAALLMAVCYPLVMYSRLGLVESLQVLFLLLAGLFWQRSPGRRWPALLAGFFAAGSVLLVKVSALFILPAMLVLVALGFLDTRGRPELALGFKINIGFLLAGAGAAALAWLLTVVLPHRQDYVGYVLRHSFESPAGNPDSPVSYLLNTLTVGGVNPFTPGSRFPLVPRLAYTAALGFPLLPGFGTSRSTGFRFLFVWFLFGLLMLGYMNYRPPRYEIILLPPLIAAAAAGIARLVEQGTLLPASRPGWFRRLGWTLWLWPLSIHLLFGTFGFWGLFRPESATGLIVSGLAVAVVIGLAAALVSYAFRNGLLLRSGLARLGVAALLLLLIVRLDLAQFSRWHRNRTHDLVRFSRELDAILPENAVLAGSWAPALLIESRRRALCLTDWANIHDPVGRFGMTHLLSHEENDIRLLEPAWPDLRARLRPVWQGTVRGTRLTAFELTRPGEN